MKKSSPFVIIRFRNTDQCSTCPLETMVLRLDYPTLRIFLAGMLAMMLVYTLIAYLWHRKRTLWFFITAILFCVSGTLLAFISYQRGWPSRPSDLPLTFPPIPVEIGIVLVTIGISIGISLLNRWQTRQMEHDTIRQQAQLIEQLQENERKQAKLNRLRDEIARDLQGEIESQLSSISILSQTTMRYAADERAHQRLITIRQTARQVMEAVQEIVWSLKASGDTKQDLDLRIRETAHALFVDSSVGLYVRLPETDQLPDLTEKQKREIFLITNESLVNALRHARAKRVGLRLHTETNRVVVTICDDGVGFDQTAETSGLGLPSIRQRTSKLNGELRIESGYGEGTTITLICPLSAEKPVNELLLSGQFVLTTQNP